MNSRKNIRINSTQPERLAVRPPIEEPISGQKKNRSTMPSPSRDKKPTLRELVDNLSSPRPDLRVSSVRKLKEFVDSPDKARDVYSMLPPDKPLFRSISEVRKHCIEILKKGI